MLQDGVRSHLRTGDDRDPLLDHDELVGSQLGRERLHEDRATQHRQGHLRLPVLCLLGRDRKHLLNAVLSATTELRAASEEPERVDWFQTGGTTHLELVSEFGAMASYLSHR